MAKLYRHKKSGMIYELITDNFMFKGIPLDIVSESVDGISDRLEWRKNLILYRALYDNPDGEYFGRFKYDFYENFEPLNDDTVKKL